MERFKDTDHPVLKSISALHGGILTKKNNRGSFRIIISVNQAQYVGISFELVLTLRFERGRRTTGNHKEFVTKGVLTSVKSQEVKLLVSLPKLLSGSSLRENIQDFESLSETTRFTRVCEGASFVRMLIVLQPQMPGS